MSSSSESDPVTSDLVTSDLVASYPVASARDAHGPARDRAGRVSARPPRGARGFTLIELIVVIAIIAALAAVVAPAIFRNVGDAKAGAAKSQLEIFGLALQQYRLDTDAFPTSEQGLAALRTPPIAPGADGQPVHNWRGPYLTRAVPLDPWGRPYHYVAPGTANPGAYDLYTLGRDGTPGGTGEDADLTSWGGAVTDAPGATPTAAGDPAPVPDVTR